MRLFNHPLRSLSLFVAEIFTLTWNIRLATPPPVVLVNGQDNIEINGDNMSLSMQHSKPPMENFYDNAPNRTSITFRECDSAERTNVDEVESHIVGEILTADWYVD